MALPAPSTHTCTHTWTRPFGHLTVAVIKHIQRCLPDQHHLTSGLCSKHKMPLPAALLKRLSKRGLVNDAAKRSRTTEPHLAPAEEIIAEDYDDEEQEPEPPVEPDYSYPSVAKTRKPNWGERIKQRIVASNINQKGYRACPNKYNVHHNCTIHCVNAYGDGIAPSDAYLRRKERLLSRYPLPSDWNEIFDEGS